MRKPKPTPSPPIPKPRAPNSKHLIGGVTLPVKFDADTMMRLRLRAGYETARLSLTGEKRVVSPQDLTRNAVRLYLKSHPALPTTELMRAAKR